MNAGLAKATGGSTARNVFDALFHRAPIIAATAAFLFGAAALLAAVVSVTPAIPGLGPIEAIADEWPAFAESIAGVVLMALAMGLRRRLDTAWAGATALLGFIAAYAFLRHEHPLAGAVCLAGCGLLFVSRRAFYRHAGLSALVPSRPLYLAIAAAITCAAMGAILWAAERQGFAEAPWWTLFTDGHIGRAGRVAAAAAVGLLAILVWSAIVAPARRNPPAPGPEELARFDGLIAAGEAVRAEAQLAFLGDKSFVFAPDGSAAVMAARAGASLAAMGAPVGRRSSWPAALGRFREEAERLGLRPVVYAAPPDLLPDLLDLGFRMEKIGENAVVNLKTFTMVGTRRQLLRSARRKLAEREGATLEIEPAGAPATVIEPLRPVSDAWLAMHKSTEKSFSLGRFEPAFMARGPVAVVRQRGRPIAFATLWTTPDRAWAAIDLMRYDPASAPHGTMDFLITECLLWAQKAGFERFDLGMAPLSGLAEEPNAPLFAKLGRLVYEQGGAFYNFDGLRKFKEKFDPEWEPRYLAAPGAWSLPIVLAEIALLTSRP
ncbi:MAG: GNAT family N-acetyltransferase [Hyphomonadaceae bacterium]|nr:GNAT family N-acetyltransferase [Hyphomonadaceae bacterium]